MDKGERISAHHIDIGPQYLPDPHRHLKNQRDLFHFEKTLGFIERVGAKSVLDVGCFDGWLDFLLMEKGCDVTGVELIPSLAAAAERYAEEHHLDYKIYKGFFDEIKFSAWDKFDVVLCLETLEHIEIDAVFDYTKMMDALALKGVFISLPDQDHLGNRQHMWTPTESVIKDLWGKKKNFTLDYHKYNSSHIPPNWLISYEV